MRIWWSCLFLLHIRLWLEFKTIALAISIFQLLLFFIVLIEEASFFAAIIVALIDLDWHFNNIFSFSRAPAMIITSSFTQRFITGFQL